MKLIPGKDSFGQNFYWVGHKNAINTSPMMKRLIKRRYDIEIIGGVIDEEASYSYDEFALCELDGAYYLLSTSGCSCPSADETWIIEIGPATLSQISEHIRGGHYDGYTLPKMKEAEFLKLIDAAACSPLNA